MSDSQVRRAASPNTGATFFSCACQRSMEIAARHAEWCDVLAEIRLACPVLRELLLPDAFWDKFVGRTAWLGSGVSDQNQGCHGSIVAIALERGKLAELTTPMHRFLFDGERLRTSATTQVRKDLVESWLLQSDAMERHRKSRILSGILNELLLAEELQARGCEITGLSALGGIDDLSFLDQNGISYAVQAKFIGQTDQEFQHVVDGFVGRAKCINGDIPGAFAYLRLRAAEAAAQFTGTGHRRVACLTISEMAFTTSHVTAMIESWSDLCDVRDSKRMQELLEALPEPSRSRWSIARIDASLRNLDEIWLCQQRNNFGISLPCALINPSSPARVQP